MITIIVTDRKGRDHTFKEVTDFRINERVLSITHMKDYNVELSYDRFMPEDWLIVSTFKQE